MIKSFKIEGYYIERKKCKYIPIFKKWYLMKEVSCTDEIGNIKITQHVVDCFWLKSLAEDVLNVYKDHPKTH